MENFDKKQSILKILHVPRAMSSHSEQSVDFSSPIKYKAKPVNVTCIVLYDSFKFNYIKILIIFIELRALNFHLF